jgi:molybdopterin-guanine dinucleotide biosynthesis protein A
MSGCGPHCFAGFVLAGGLSSRMGTDKSALVFRGKSLLAHAIDVIRSATDTITIVGNPEIHIVDSVPVISDGIRGAGPLAGIAAALASSRSPWNLVLACDMPLLQGEILQAIMQRALREPACDAVVPLSGTRAQPLCAAYHLRSLPTIRAALASGKLKIMEALHSGSLRLGHIEIVSAEPFRNVNTPEDWQALLLEPTPEKSA